MLYSGIGFLQPCKKLCKALRSPGDFFANLHIHRWKGKFYFLSFHSLLHDILVTNINQYLSVCSHFWNLHSCNKYQPIYVCLFTFLKFHLSQHIILNLCTWWMPILCMIEGEGKRGARGSCDCWCWRYCLCQSTCFSACTFSSAICCTGKFHSLPSHLQVTSNHEPFLFVFFCVKVHWSDHKFWVLMNANTFYD